MAQFYTLKEAAEKLGVTPEDMKRRLQSEWSHVKPMLGGQGPMYRAQVIDELARTLGRGSDPELQLGDSVAAAAAKARKPSADDPLPVDADLSITLDDEPVSTQPKTAPVPGPVLKGGDTPRLAGDADVIGFADDASVAPKGAPNDSDVKLERDTSKLPRQPIGGGGTDEIDLDAAPAAPPPARKPPALPEASPPTQAIPRPLPPQPPGSGKLKPALPAQPPGSGKLKPPKIVPPVADVGSSEFELQLNEDDDDEAIDFGKSSKDLRRSTDSGINLQRPADSGISLERASDDEIDFELNLDAASSQVISSKSQKNIPQQDANSEFELTLDDEGDLSLDEPTAAGSSGGGGSKKDIFETDFEIPALEDESASEAIGIEEADTDLESSDFDLEMNDEGATADDSSSAVVAISEDGDEPAEVDFDAEAGEEEESGSVSSALRGFRRTGGDEDEEEEEYATASSAAAPPAEWGVVPALILLPTVLVMGLTGLMGFELLRGMWGYHQPSKPTASVTGLLAGTFMDPTDHKAVFGGE